MRKQQYFITATGTEIGKTALVTELLRFLRRGNRHCMALKPIISGFTPESLAKTDTGKILDALGLPMSPAQVNGVSPWRYEAPLSPDLAAKYAGETIDFNDLVDYCYQMIEQDYDALLIEGVGGVMVPICEGYTVLDWISTLNMPAILVTGTYLGAISHTLCAVNALKSQKIRIAAVVVNESDNTHVSIEDTVASLENHIHGIPIFSLKRNQAAFSVQSPFLELCHHLFGVKQAQSLPSRLLDYAL